MKVRKNRIFIVVIVSGCILILLWPYINYIRREVYVKRPNGDLVSKSDIVYEYCGGNFDNVKKEKAIGRLEGDKFYNFGGTTLWKLEGYAEDDLIYETALMWEAAYKRK